MIESVLRLFATKSNFEVVKVISLFEGEDEGRNIIGYYEKVIRLDL